MPSPSPPIPVVPYIIPLEKLVALNDEKDGIMEAMLCLRGYCEEVYKDGIVPSGLKMVVDKLGDKLKLVEEEIKFITPP